MSSPTPVGRFLICSATIAAPPHFVSGCPDRTESAVGTAPAASVLYEALTAWAAPVEQAPGLIDPDIAGEVGNRPPAIGVRPRPGGADRARDAQIVDRRTGPHRR